MRRLRTILALGVPALAAVLTAASLLSPARATRPDGVSLMQTLSQWEYPGSKLPDGASMSDGGNPLISSLKCQAVLTTPDPIEKVFEFYAKKLEPAPPIGRQDKQAQVKDGDAKAVSTQNDSRGRPLTLRVIVVNKADSTTSLAISRAEGEKETHIAWSHYLRLEKNR